VSPRITFARVVRSEWTKVCASRSTWLTLGAVAVLGIGIAGAVGYGVRRSVLAGDPAPTVAQAVGAAFLPMDFLVLVLGVFGILQMSGEYGSGLIRATLTTVPRRWPVLCAKSLALLAVTAPAMAAVSLASFLACQAFLGDIGASLRDPGVARAVIGAAACPLLIAQFGLGIGALLRNTAGSITTLATGLLIIPALLVPALPDAWDDDVLKFVPTVAGQAMYGMDGQGLPFETLSPVVSGLVLAGWAGVLLAGGAAVLRQRDA
jgi:ABC-2 type transport system permease protein